MSTTIRKGDLIARAVKLLDDAEKGSHYRLTTEECVDIANAYARLARAIDGRADSSYVVARDPYRG